MIPVNIKKNHILEALKMIDIQGVPNGRISSKYELVYGGRLYPPKFVISLANIFANDVELPQSEFSGGKEANTFLLKNGFEISDQSTKLIKIVKKPKSEVMKSKKIKNDAPIKKHNQRCSDCKNIIIDMFRKIYGNVKIEHKMEINSRLEDYLNEDYYEDLEKIYNAIAAQRGKKDFVRSKFLQPCDIYIPNPGFIVELDESQHFTSLRKTSLLNYPVKLQTGFEIQKWIQNCDRYNAKDNNPLYRDEQRAWYDTLRDFIPLIKGIQPTIRIGMFDYDWCNLNPNKVEDVEKFKSLLFVKLESSTPEENKLVKVMLKNKVQIATVCLQSNHVYTNKSRVSLLFNLIDKLSDNVDLILLPAGYIHTKYKPSEIYQELESDICHYLQNNNSNLSICLGIDGRNGLDQMAVLYTKNGMEALGRKFYPTNYETISGAKSYLSEEDGYSRIFKLKGKNFYMAVCYDVFGIKKQDNPGVDVVLDLVHRFHPKKEGISGDVFFARHGFAGASQQWNCPTFGAAVYFNREISKNWPTGVEWNGSKEHTKYWKYTDNPLTYFDEIVIKGNETAQVRLFEV